MVRIVYYCLLLVSFPFVVFSKPASVHIEGLVKQDTTEEEVSEEAKAQINTLNTKAMTVDSIDVVDVRNNPYVHVGDYLKGRASGVLVQQTSAEPGSYQNIVIRGLSTPQFSARAVNSNTAAVYVNGIPMVRENSFTYNIQQYDFSRIGPATDYLASLDISTIKSIEIIKDPIRLAELGPMAANGAVWITTYGGKTGEREISVNSYIGLNTKPVVTPYNAEYENRFRRQFYNQYGNIDDDLKYPGYLSDSTNLNYYGVSNWRDEYYSNAASYNADINIKGGSDRANFAFFGGYARNAISSDNTDFKRYNVLFNVNMLPFKWFTVSTYINAKRTDRDRNTNLRDRFVEMAYLPDLSTPMSPNKAVYGNYIDIYNRKVVDDNITNGLQGYMKIDLNILDNLKFTTNFMLDYNEGIRDLFYPREYMETINYMSTYYGYSQRYIFSNKVAYTLDLNDKNRFNLTVGSDYQEDLYRYNFARAYDGPNDYIKLNTVEGDVNKGDYLTPQGGLRVLRWNNKEQFHLHSLYGRVDYSFNDIFDINGVLRWDGASTIQRDSRWMFTPAVSGAWHINKQFGLEEIFNLRASYGRVAVPNYDSRFATGPQYSTSLGWEQEPTVYTYYGYAGITRNYNSGWVGYNLDWAHSDKLELSLNNSFFNSRLNTSLSLYQTDDNNQIVIVPVPGEYGYVGEYKNGMNVRNRGFEGIISGKILAPSEDRLVWTSSLNFNINQNELTALPNNLQELQVGNRLLKVGSPIDSYWLYKNNGMYSSTSEIPSNGGVSLSFDGVPFAVGDAKWVDQNNDNMINDLDRVVEGRSTPKVFGGFNNNFSYKGIDLNVLMTYALGNKIMNQRAANRYDFINNETSNSINGVREIFQWQQDLDITKYPIYNVWSDTNPYRVDQDLFLEDASYLKLRSLTVGYDLSRLSAVKDISPMIRRVYVYFNANNLFTVTSFSGNDPELVNYNGYYDGYGLPLTRTFTLGFKLDL